MDSLPEWIICLRLIYVILIFIVGVSGNGAILLVQLKNRKKSSTDCLILAMAIFDFVLAGIVSPMVALQSFTEFWSQLSTDWACKFYQYAVFSSTFASTQLLAAVAFDRYRNTCKPHAKWFGPKAAVKLAIFVTMNSMTICSILLFFAGVKKDGTCGIYADRRFEGTMFSISVSTLFFTMIVIVTVCYSMVASTLHKRHRQKVQEKQPRVDSVSASTRSNRISLFKRKNKVKAVGLSLFTINDNLKEGQASDSGQGIEPKPGPSCMRDETQTAAASQESDEGPSGNSFERNDKRGINRDAENWSHIQDFANVKQTSDSVLSWQLFDRATCGPTARRPDGDQKEGTTCDTGDINGDRKQATITQLTREEHKINKTTKMMFLITVIYTVSWIVVSVTGGYASFAVNSSTEMRLVLTRLLNLTFMINSVSNPIFYLLMSSLFRKRIRALFSKK